MSHRSFGFSSEFSLRVLSYNIKGTPFPASRNHWRFKEIGKQLLEKRKSSHGPHVVLFQEAFIKKAKELNRFAKYPYELSARSENILDSGLMAFSEFPIEHIHNFEFKDSDCSSYDCLAKKGAQIIKLAHPLFKDGIYILNTHLQSGGSEKADRIRKQQIDEIYTVLNEKVDLENDLLFLIGDFNFKPERESFHYFKKLFPKALHSGEDCLTRSLCKISLKTLDEEVVEKTHDHHFFISNQTYVVPLFLDRNFREKVKGKFLSDHFGYEVHYMIHPKM